MPEFDIELDAVFRKYGGMLDCRKLGLYGYDDLLDNCIGIIKAKFSRTPDLPMPKVGYINSSQFNALATFHNGTYCIGVNIGVVCILEDVFLRMLSSKNTFPSIGNPDLEGDTCKIYNPLHCDFSSYQLAIEKDSNWPKDRTRAAAVLNLVQHAMHFLLCHEYVHIINGHVDYLTSVLTDKYFSEIQFNQLDEESGMLFQTLELDADAIACSIMMNTFLGIVGTNKNNDDLIGLFYQDWKSVLSHFAIAAYCMFKLMSIAGYKQSVLRKRSHPPAANRIEYILAAIATFAIDRKKSEILNAFHQVLGRSILEAEQAFHEISEVEMDNVPFILPAINGELRSHTSDIEDNWNEVRPLLLPYTKHSLAPRRDIRAKH